MNLSDISSRLGVSVSTVSRALRNAEGVDTRTRARVLEEAARAGYKGPSRSPSHRGGKTRTLLVLSHSEAGALHYGAMAGMSQAAVEMNVSILTHQTPPEDPESILTPRLQPPAMRSGQVDGIILLREWPDSVTAELSRMLPVVTVIHGSGITDEVGIDLQAGMETLVRHLSSARRGPCGLLLSGQDPVFGRRLSGAFSAACSAAGQEAGRILVSADLQPEGEGFERLAPAGIRSWICDSQPSGEILLNGFRNSGMSVPDDVSIAVALPQGRSAGTPPRWTSLDVRAEDLGVAAVRRILHRIDSPAESRRSILLNPGLTLGETTPHATH